MTVYVRPIFYDVEVDGKLEEGAPLPHITELAAYDPTRTGAAAKFSVLLEPEILQSIRPPEINLQDPNANLRKYKFKEIWPKFLEWCHEGRTPSMQVVMIAHNNYDHDKKLLELECIRNGTALPREWKWFDTYRVAKNLFGEGQCGLQALREHYKIPYAGAHRAQYDVDTLYQVFENMVKNVDRQKIYQAMLQYYCNDSVTTLIKVHRTIVPIFFDTETTGLLKERKEDPGEDPRIVELAAYTPTRTGEAARFARLVNPEMPIPESAMEKHHITDAMVKNEKPFKKVFKHFVKWVHANKDPDSTIVLIAHNCIKYDMVVLSKEVDRIGQKLPKWNFFCTLFLSRHMHTGPEYLQWEKAKWRRLETERQNREMERKLKAEAEGTKYEPQEAPLKAPDRFHHDLSNLADFYSVPVTNAHRAMADVEVMFQVWERMLGPASRREVLEAAIRPPSESPVKAVGLVIRQARLKLAESAKKRPALEEPAAVMQNDAGAAQAKGPVASAEKPAAHPLKRLRKAVKDEDEDLALVEVQGQRDQRA